MLFRSFPVGSDGDTSKLRLNVNRKNYNDWFRERMEAKDPIIGPNATWRKEQTAPTTAAPPSAQTPVPTQADRDWVKNNPQDRDKFIKRFKVEP